MSTDKAGSNQVGSEYDHAVPRDAMPGDDDVEGVGAHAMPAGDELASDLSAGYRPADGELADGELVRDDDRVVVAVEDDRTQPATSGPASVSREAGNAAFAADAQGTVSDVGSAAVPSSASSPAEVPSSASSPSEASSSASIPAVVTPSASSPTPAAAEPLANRGSERSAGQWHEIQAMFVDDPRMSVEQAAGLVDDSVEALVAAVQTRQSSLASAWQDNKADTEQLRTALQQYRVFWNRLDDFSVES